MGLFSKIKNKFSKIALSFSLLLGAAAGVAGLANVGWAKGVSGWLIDHVSADFSDNRIGSREWKCLSNNSFSGTCSGGNLFASNTTLTLTNTLGSDAQVVFDYQTTGSSVTVDGHQHGSSSKGQINRKWPKGNTIEITLEAAKNTKVSVTVTNFQLIDLSKMAYITFSDSQNGSFIVKKDGTVVEHNKQETYSPATSFNLVASPNSGYYFTGWKKDDTYVSFDKTFTYVAETGTYSISPVFSKSDGAVFKNNSNYYEGLQEAIDSAKGSSDKSIIVASNGSVPAGNYTIPDGVTLYVPNDETSFADYKKEAGSYSETNSTPVLYRSLLLQNGCKITCKGASSIVVCCKIYANSNGVMSNPVGPYGEIKMDIGSKITLEYGSSLYAWGFISGSDDFVDPAIEAMSGSKIYEMFQIMTWRGGTASSSMVNNKEKVFLFNQYCVQNIEVPLKLNAGAIERGTVAVKVSKLFRQISFIFIGGSNEGMFRLDEGASIVKRYHKGTDKDSDADRLQFYLNGNGSLKNIEFTVDGLAGFIGNVEIKSQNYILPIGSNFDIYVESGTTTIGQGIAVLPDAKITVSKGAAVNVSADTYLYNLADWKGQGFGYNCDLSQVNRISSGKPFPRTLKSGATLDINGSVTVNSGAHLYATSGTLNASLNTTTNQAKVISSEKTGSITFADGKAANSTTHQAVQDGTGISYKEIPVENAKLYNGDSSVYSKEIKSGEKIPYTAAQDVWGTLIFEERIGLYYQEDGKIAFYNIKGTFESKTGIFYYDSTVYPCGDNEYYLLSQGYVEIYKGIYRDSSSLSYYFFGQSNTAYRNGSYFIPNADKLGHFFPGSFKFDNKGKLISVVSSGSVSTDMTKYIDDGKLKIDGVIAGIGLFELTDGYIYYAKDDGSVVKNSTCYVSKTNDVQDASNNPIKAGLYWFDAEGHLCDSLMRPIYKGA